jgi:hypothetical protein
MCFFAQGHQKYVELVQTRKVYQLNMKEQAWMRMKGLGDFCTVKVSNIRFEIRPPRLCVLKLAILNQHTLRATGESFTIK